MHRVEDGEDRERVRCLPPREQGTLCRAAAPATCMTKIGTTCAHRRVEAQASTHCQHSRRQGKVGAQQLSADAPRPSSNVVPAVMDSSGGRLSTIRGCSSHPDRAPQSASTSSDAVHETPSLSTSAVARLVDLLFSEQRVRMEASQLRALSGHVYTQAARDHLLASEPEQAALCTLTADRLQVRRHAGARRTLTSHVA